jgi:hypothetical protein
MLTNSPASRRLPTIKNTFADRAQDDYLPERAMRYVYGNLSKSSASDVPSFRRRLAGVSFHVLFLAIIGGCTTLRNTHQRPSRNVPSDYQH